MLRNKSTEDIGTIFLNKGDFEIVKDRLKLENQELFDIVNEARESDVFALEFSINSPPLIKNISILKGGNFAPFWLEKFREEGVTQEQINEAFSELK